MPWFVTISTLTGLSLIVLGLWYVWPPVALIATGGVLLKVAWSVDNNGGAE